VSAFGSGDDFLVLGWDGALIGASGSLLTASTPLPPWLLSLSNE